VTERLTQILNADSSSRDGGKIPQLYGLECTWDLMRNFRHRSLKCGVLRAQCALQVVTCKRHVCAVKMQTVLACWIFICCSVAAWPRWL